MTEEEITALVARHKKQVERRAKFLAKLTPKERKTRDSYIAYVRWWRKEYNQVTKNITVNKAFVRKQGHNNLASLKMAMRRLHTMRLQARTMLLARAAAKAHYQDLTT